MNIRNVFLAVFITFYIISCNSNPTPDKLQLSVKNTFNLLPEKPQFVMYVNFKYMRTTDFWKTNLSDSIFSSENTFGSMLYVFKTATGATISDGLDEMFFANSWTGENAIVMKGSFDRIKMTTYLGNDSLFVKIDKHDGLSYYKHKNSNTMFFLKDNYTLCASNYEEQLKKMKDASDTSNTGLVTNKELMTAINEIIHKDNLWLISTERTFIRGVFTNFIDLKSGKNFTKNILDSLSGENNDSLSKNDDIISNKIYEKVSSISLNAKMKNDMDLLLQFECVDRDATIYLDKLFNGIIGIAKITSASIKDKKDTAFEKILNEISIQNFDNTLLIKIIVNNTNVQDFRNSNLFINK